MPKEPWLVNTEEEEAVEWAEVVEWASEDVVEDEANCINVLLR